MYRRFERKTFYGLIMFGDGSGRGWRKYEENSLWRGGEDGKMRQPIPVDFLAVPKSPGLMGSARSPS